MNTPLETNKSGYTLEPNSRLKHRQIEMTDVHKKDFRKKGKSSCIRGSLKITEVFS